MRRQNPVSISMAASKLMKKIDVSTVPAQSREAPIRIPSTSPAAAQSCQRLARHAGLTQFGVNLTVIEPGAWSSQRHWHSHEDEFVWVVEGELTLITDSGRRDIARRGLRGLQEW